MKKRKKKSRTPPKMKKRERKTGRSSKMRPREQAELRLRMIPPLDPEEFKRVFALAMKAAAKERPPTNSELPGGKMVEEDGSVSEDQVAETPFTWSMDPVMAHYKDEVLQGLSAMTRVDEIMELARAGALGQWVRPNSDTLDSLIHPAVIEAAATIRLTKALRFPLPEFLREVRRIASEKYPEGDAW